jgi:hypothetical protein
VRFWALGLVATSLFAGPLQCALKEGAILPDAGNLNPMPLPARPVGPGLCAYAFFPSAGGPQLRELPLAWLEVWPAWATPLLGGTAPSQSDKWSVIGDVPEAVSAPTSVSWSRMRTDVFYTTAAGTLGHTYTDDFGQTYHGTKDLGSLTGYKLVGRPDAASWAEGRIDVMGMAEPLNDGGDVGEKVVLHGVYDGVSVRWENWAWPVTDGTVPIAMSGPTVIAPEVGRLEACFIGSDSSLWLRELNDTGPPYGEAPMPWRAIPSGGYLLGASIDGAGWDLMAINRLGSLAHFNGVDPINQQNWLDWPSVSSLASAEPTLSSVSIAQTGAGAFAVLAVVPTGATSLFFWLSASNTGGNILPIWFNPSDPDPPLLPLGDAIELTAW